MTSVPTEIPDNESYFFFGSHGFFIFSKSNFINEQLGYRSDTDGNDLTGTGKGDWSPH